MAKITIGLVSAPASMADTGGADPLLAKRVEVARGDACFAVTCRLVSHHLTLPVSKSGTAVLIGPDLVVTAAHNVFDPDVFGADRKGGYCGQVDITPGYVVSGNSVAAMQTTYNIAAHGGFVGDDDVAFDLAMILLPAAFSHTNRFPKPASRKDSKLTNINARVIGFPVDRKPLAMMSASGAVKGVEPNRLFYLVTTSPGQSGGPVFDADGDGSEVLGLHTYDNEQTPPGLSPAHSATRFSDDLIAWLKDAEQHLRNKP